jgi:hypothetical protein
MARGNRRLATALSMLILAAGGCSTESSGTATGTGGAGGAGPPPATCAPGLADCGGACVDLTTSNANCGACGQACSAGSNCVAGACECGNGLLDCGAGCVDTESDGANCGACAAACPGARACSLGACSGACAPGLVACGRSCVDTQTSPFHCGDCDRACGAGQTCVVGACQCGAGQTLCGGACVDLQTDAANCGACAAACAGTCTAGVCEVPGAGGAGGTGGAAGAPVVPGDAVDATTLDRKHLFGYQGWFACAGDGSPFNRWVHWTNGGTPDGTNVKHEMWPDMSKLDADELFATNMTYQGGAVAKLYSGYNAKTIARHFRWMREAGIDGVLVQRFLNEVEGQGEGYRQRNGVTEGVRAGAEAEGRVFAIEYDISGANAGNLVANLTGDWQRLVDTLAITDSPQYLRHHGKPVVAIWGFGFENRPGTADQARQIIEWFHTGAAAKYQATLVGGVPTDWVTAGEPWASVYRSFDVVSPWTVGRYNSDAGADAHKNDHLVPDLAATAAAGIEYLPVVFPGFSWSNWNGGAFNQIPRRGGQFYWRQVYNALSAGSTMLKTAMFDEVDEGTAMYKVAPSPAQAPINVGGKQWLTLAADGLDLPSDFYLRLGGEASRALRGEIPISATQPITR